MFATIKRTIEAFKSGKFILVIDSESRENEADLMISCSHITTEKMNFIIKEGRGLICLATTKKKLDSLNLEPMLSSNNSFHETAFYTSIDAIKNTTTGISASDRAQTCLQFIHSSVKKEDFVSPGHIFPLCAHEKGLSGRKGHTEAAVEIAHLARLPLSTIICEVIDDDGTMLKGERLKKYAQKWDIPICRIEDLIQHKMKKSIQENSVEVPLPTPYGTFNLIAYQNPFDKLEYVALVLGNLTKHKKESIPIRIHSQCFTGDVLHSFRCDCREQLDAAFKYIQAKQFGIILYLPQEGRGIGLYNKIKAYALQEKGYDTLEANQELGLQVDSRDYTYAVKIIESFQVNKIDLLTNNPEKVNAFKESNISIQRVPLQVKERPENKNYLNTKKHKMGHLL